MNPTEEHRGWFEVGYVARLQTDLCLWVRISVACKGRNLSAVMAMVIGENQRGFPKAVLEGDFYFIFQTNVREKVSCGDGVGPNSRGGVSENHITTT